MPLQMQDIHVTGLIEEEQDRGDGVTQFMTRVYYNIAEFGPYSVLIPKLELSAQRVLQEVRQDSQRYLDILNLTF